MQDHTPKGSNGSRNASPVPPSGPPASVEADFLNIIYEVAVAPERIGDLVTFWAQRVEGARHVSGTRGPARNGRSPDGALPASTLPHLARAEELLRLVLREKHSSFLAVQSWVHAKQHAAFAVGPSGSIVCANKAAKRAFGLTETSRISDLEFSGNGDATDFLMSHNAGPQIFWVRGRGRTEFFAAARTYPIAPECDSIGVTADFIDWPDHFSALLAETYAFTASEIEVLRVLLRGRSPNAIAEETGRSIATVRSHIRSLLEKTLTNSLLELVRLCLGLMAITVPLAGGASPSRGVAEPVEAGSRANRYKVLRLRDGRDRAYVETGDPDGRPCLLFPSPLGLFRFPPAVEASIARQGLRIITPLRPSLGPSSLHPKNADVIETFARDTLALMDALDIRRAPVVCISMDLLHGVTLANLAPARVSAVIGSGAMLPVTEHEHLQRLETIARFIYKNTRVAPRITNIITYSFVYMGRISGPTRPLRSMLKASPIDTALLDDPEICEAMTMGSPANFAPNFAIHEACSKEVEAFVADWRDVLVSCPSPVVLLNGDSSPWNPLATLEEFAARSSNIKPVILPQTGLMVAHQHPDILIAEIKRWL